MLIKKFFVATFLFALLVLVGCGGGEVEDVSSESETITINIGHVGANVSPQQGAVEIFEELVKEKTGGSVELQIYNSSQLGNEEELVEGLQLGSVDGAIVSAGLFSTIYDVMGAFEVPFLFEDREHALAVNTGEIGSEVLSKLEEKSNLKPLAIWDHGFRQVTNSKRPIETPEDLQGINIRSPQVPAYDFALDALGAVSIPLSFDELYVALDRGVVDGQHNPLMHISGQRFYEVQEYMSVMDFAYTPNIFALSNSIWDKLSEEQQEQIKEAATETAIKWSEKYAEEDEKILEELEEKMQIKHLTKEERDEFSKIVKEKAYPKYRTDIGEEFVNFLETVQKEASN